MNNNNGSNNSNNGNGNGNGSNNLNNGIIWPLDPAWKSWTIELGYPRLQNSLSINQLTKEKQDSLLRAYNNVMKNQQ